MERVILTQAKYTAAYACMLGDACPQQVGGCPSWVEQMEHGSTHESRIVAGCAPQIAQHNLMYFLRAADRPGAEMAAMRKEVTEAATAGLDCMRAEVLRLAFDLEKPNLTIKHGVTIDG